MSETPTAANVIKNGTSVDVSFTTPVWAPAPGQSVMLYANEVTNATTKAATNVDEIMEKVFLSSKSDTKNQRFTQVLGGGVIE